MFNNPAFPDLTFVAGGTLANPSVLSGPGAVVVTYPVVNNTCYPLNLMIHCALDMDISTAIPNVLFIGPRVTMTGGLGTIVNPQQALFGTDVGGLLAFRQYSFTYPIGQLAPGAVATINQDVTYFYNTGGPTIADHIHRLFMTTRVWGGGA